MITKFEPVKVAATKSGKCTCGKRINRSITLEQTLNPWNKKPDGTIKDLDDILVELREKLAEWREYPVHHKVPDGFYWKLSEAERKAYDDGEGANVKLSCGESYQIFKDEPNDR